MRKGEYYKCKKSSSPLNNSKFLRTIFSSEKAKIDQKLNHEPKGKNNHIK